MMWSNLVAGARRNVCGGCVRADKICSARGGRCSIGSRNVSRLKRTSVFARVCAMFRPHVSQPRGEAGGKLVEQWRKNVAIAL